MGQHELSQKLAQLNDEISQTSEVNPENLELLRKLTADIDRLLEQQDEAGEEDTESVTGGLKDLLLKFEADHPELSISLGKVADALAAIGI
jgi:hypothetical protein